MQQARGDVAEQESIGETRVAEAERDRVIQVANANKLREIGTREAQREQAVRLAELDKEQKIGEQTAGFERDAQVKDGPADHAREHGRRPKPRPSRARIPPRRRSLPRRPR